VGKLSRSTISTPIGAIDSIEVIKNNYYDRLYLKNKIYSSLYLVKRFLSQISSIYINRLLPPGKINPAKV
jgi:hypothetical protein